MSNLGQARRICAFLAASALGGPAQGQRYSFKNYAQDYGLTNVAVNCLAQDPRGYLWVGTQAGLYRYDGDRFRQVGDLKSLPSMDIEALAVAGERVWVGTFGGLALIERERVETVVLGERVE